MTRPLILCARGLSLFELTMELLFPAEMLMRTMEQSDSKGSPMEPTQEETASLRRSSIPGRSGDMNCQLSRAPLGQAPRSLCLTVYTSGWRLKGPLGRA